MTTDPLAAPLERALVRFRVQSAHNLLDEAFGAAPADVVARSLVLPLFERIEAAGDPGVLRFAASLFEIRLLIQARGWERIDGPAVTLACAPREERTLGLVALGLGLAARRCRVAYLGAATPTAALMRQEAALTVVSAEHDDLDAAERAELRALGTVITGRAAAPIAAALATQALDAEPARAVEQAAGLAYRRSSRAGDATSPGGT